MQLDPPNACRWRRELECHRHQYLSREELREHATTAIDARFDVNAMIIPHVASDVCNSTSHALTPDQPKGEA